MELCRRFLRSRLLISLVSACLQNTPLEFKTPRLIFGLNLPETPSDRLADLLPSWSKKVPPARCGCAITHCRR
jgi:hypothetical protein